MAGKDIKEDLQELLHHSSESTEELLEQIQAMVRALGNVEATLQHTSKVASDLRESVSQKCADLRESLSNCNPPPPGSAEGVHSDTDKYLHHSIHHTDKYVVQR